MDILTLLYTATGFVFGAAFVPQIIALIKDNTGAAAISIASVLTFTVCSVITLIYALVNNGDVYFVFATAVCNIGNVAVLALASFRRWQKYSEEQQEHLALSTQEVRVRQ